jgi:glutathione S-transferase
VADASTPILHHYPNSPFSEKVRLVMGMKGLAWGSVEIPVIMPKPDLTPLTGGYRRTPVMQIGADVYCDTQLIIRELERRYPSPSILPEGHDGLAWMLSTWADRTFFQITVPVIFGAVGFHVPEAFKRDREQLSGRPFDTDAMRAMAPMMKDQWRANVAFIDEALEANPHGWLSGEEAGLVDISAFMNLWFLRNAFRPGYDAAIAEYDRVEAWTARVEAIGHGKPETLTGTEALAIAREAEPDDRGPADPREPQGLRTGDLVTVVPDDYGRDPVTGTLVFSSAQEIALERTDSDLGRIVVHFPRAGYLARRS